MVGDRIHLEDAFYSSFKPWPNRYTVSPDVAKREAPEAYLKWIAEDEAEVEETVSDPVDQAELTDKNGSPGETGGLQEEDTTDG